MENLKSLYNSSKKDDINLTLYLDENNGVYSIKNKIESVENGTIDRETTLHNKENQYNMLQSTN